MHDIDFAARWEEAQEGCSGSPLAVGLDPTPQSIPRELAPADGAPIEEWVAAYGQFCDGVLDACRPFSALTKIQSAFFEQLGPSGAKLFFRCVARAKELGYLVLADVKRNDIGHTANAYAAAFLGDSDRPWAHDPSHTFADAMTVVPIFGDDGNQPYLDMADRGAGLFFIVRSSNPSSAQLQTLALQGGERFDHAVAALVTRYAERQRRGNATYSSVGAVVGATHPAELIDFRKRLPGSLLLLPGVGAQGADPNMLRPAFDERGRGAIVPVSRGLLHAHLGTEEAWKDAIRAKARGYASELTQLARS